MKVYISGKISGLPLLEVKEKFANAADLLDSLGLQPVNPLDNGLQEGGDMGAAHGQGH